MWEIGHHQSCLGLVVASPGRLLPTKRSWLLRSVKRSITFGRNDAGVRSPRRLHPDLHPDPRAYKVPAGPDWVREIKQLRARNARTGRAWLIRSAMAARCPEDCLQAVNARMR
jgi:hypothetical protein